MNDLIGSVYPAAQHRVLASFYQRQQKEVKRDISGRRVMALKHHTAL